MGFKEEECEMEVLGIYLVEVLVEACGVDCE
jgi:hypothetical protein